MIVLLPCSTLSTELRYALDSADPSTEVATTVEVGAVSVAVVDVETVTPEDDGTADDDGAEEDK